MSEINSFSDYTNKYNSNVDYSALFEGTSNSSSLGGTNIWRHRYKRRMEAVNMRLARSISYGHGVLLQPEMAEESDEQHKIFIEKAEELHEITGGQKQVVIEMPDDKYWKKAIRVAGGNGCLEFARKVMREFYQTR